jgi:cytochrome c biogenesis protein CcmG/thiol:disulfide interchange protein DsbE
VPETFLIDGKGRIVFKHVGPLTQDVLDKTILPKLAELKP